MKVLVLAPHPDDEVLGCGGGIHHHISAGHQVAVLVLSDRAYNHQYDPHLIARERACAEAAREVLGYQYLHFGGLQDETLDERTIDVVRVIEDAAEMFPPHTVYVPHRGDVNQDHRATFNAAMIAFRPAGRFPVQRLLSYETPSSTDQMPNLAEAQFNPNVYVDISEEAVRIKSDALSRYRAELRDFPHPRSAEGLLALARFRGMEAGLQAAEAYQLLRYVCGRRY